MNNNTGIDKRTALFFAITAAAYPLLVYVIVPWATRQTSHGGGDAAGMGMGQGFAYAYGLLFFSIFVIILSSICAHFLLRKWWFGIVALGLGIGAIKGIELGRAVLQANIKHPYTWYYDNGQLREKGMYIDYETNKHGEITEYYENGVIKSIRNYRSGDPYGKCEYFYPEGMITAVGRARGCVWKDGIDQEIPDATWTYYFKDGNIADKRTYKKGKLIRSANYTLCYDEDLKIRTIDGNKLFTGKLNKTGVVGQSNFPILVTTQVREGRCDGDYLEHYNLGDRLIVAATATFNNGELNGEVREYYEDSKLKQVSHYVVGKLEGEYTAYYADSTNAAPHGQIQYTCFYKDGKQNGTAYWYHPNGQLDTEVIFVDGMRQGTACEYDSNGVLLQKVKFVNDEEVYSNDDDVVRDLSFY